MKRAPHMTNNTLSRRRCHLRTHHDALIQLSTRQGLITPPKCPAYPPYAAKSRPALGLTGLLHRVYQTGSETSTLPKSP